MARLLRPPVQVSQIGGAFLNVPVAPEARIKPGIGEPWRHQRTPDGSASGSKSKRAVAPGNSRERLVDIVPW